MPWRKGREDRHVDFLGNNQIRKEKGCIILKNFLVTVLL
jgi:hypothetical protein